tara:strand:- start:1848 stop:2036 length:189 start_codon:yes stop_codon:yes gene_type:complete
VPGFDILLLPKDFILNVATRILSSETAEVGANEKNKKKSAQHNNAGILNGNKFDISIPINPH